jgi:hypothetical protein
MEDAHLLLDKKAAIGYGAAGASGSAPARAYAREGADMHVAGTERLDGLISRENIWIDAGAATATDIGSRNHQRIAAVLARALRRVA